MKYKIVFNLNKRCFLFYENIFKTPSALQNKFISNYNFNTVLKEEPVYPYLWKEFKLETKHYLASLTLKKLNVLRNTNHILRNSFNTLTRKLNNEVGYRNLSYFQSPNIDQVIPRSSKEVTEILAQTPISPPNSRILKIAIIGVPNSGKSTLINKIIGWRVCSVSKKVHTTQCNARAVYNDETTQLVFLDTPGIVSLEEIKKYHLKHTLVADPEISLCQADLIAVLHDVSNKYTRRALHPGILRLLVFNCSIPSVLIINKVDILKNKTALLDLTRNLTDDIVSNRKIEVSSKNETSFDAEAVRKSLLEHDADSPINKDKNLDINSKTESVSSHFKEEELDDHSVSLKDVIRGKVKPNEKQVQHLIEGKRGWPLFKEVFMLSALEGEGVEDFKHFLISSSEEGKWMFSADVLTDQTPQEIALLAVREKCLEYLDHNIPYELKFRLMYWDLSEADVMSIVIGVYCRKKNHRKMLLGMSGRKVRQIAAEAEQNLRNTFRTEVRLRVNVEFDPNVNISDI